MLSILCLIGSVNCFLRSFFAPILHYEGIEESVSFDENQHRAYSPPIDQGNVTLKNFCFDCQQKFTLFRPNAFIRINVYCVTYF